MKATVIQSNTSLYC